jgi:hypothetical protein
MPYGEGTYGSKKGRPRSGKRKTPKMRQMGPAAARPKKKKEVNVPGEKQRALVGRIDHMISKVEGEFQKWKKSRVHKR